MPKEKEKNITDKNINETPADRLNAVILKYFKTQLEVALLLGMYRTTLSSYIKGRYNITKKFAMRLQDAVGINAEYILNGTGNMVIDDTQEPYFKSDVPLISKTDTKTLHGIIKRYILEYEGSKKVLRESGEESVVSLALGNLEEKSAPFMAYNSLDEFEEHYNISVGSTIILKKNYVNGDLVLYTYNEQECEIGIFNKKENQITEWKTKAEYKVEDVDIMGRVIGKFEKIKFKGKNKTDRFF